MQQNISATPFKENTLAKFTIFMNQQTLCGLPTNVFIFGAAISLCITFLLYWLAGITFASLFFYGMYKIHEKDQKALAIWLHAWQCTLRYKSGRHRAASGYSTRLIIIS